MSNVTIKASVIVPLIIDVSDSWGGDCKLEQVYEQAKKSAIDRISGLIAAANESGRSIRATIKSPIEVTAILVTR